jgi:hypothetical protein
MYKVLRESPRNKQRIGYLLSGIGTNLVASVFFSYLLLRYEYERQDTDFERKVFLLFLPGIAGIGFFIASVFVERVVEKRFNLRTMITLALMVVVAHFPAGILSSLIVSGLGFKYPEQELYGNIALEVMTLFIVNGLGCLLFILRLVVFPSMEEDRQ